MREQVETLKGRGARVVCVGDALSEGCVHNEIHKGRYKFVYFSPELLLTNCE